MEKADVVLSKKASKQYEKAPKEIKQAYDAWELKVIYSGTRALRELPGLRDEALKGPWAGLRSSRLNNKWRVIYKVIDSSSKVEVVNVEEINAHDYRRKK